MREKVRIYEMSPWRCVGPWPVWRGRAWLGVWGGDRTDKRIDQLRCSRGMIRRPFDLEYRIEVL
jgi:hypothetical protein